MSAIEGKHIREGRILSVSERRGLEKEIERDRAYLGNQIDVDAARTGDRLANMPERRRRYIESQTTWDPGLDDKMAVHARIRRRMRALANGQPDSISEPERAAIEKRAREHEEFFKSNMLPRSQTSLPYGHPDFQKAVGLGLREQSQEFQRRATDWKNIQRQLAPEDPSASNLERIRPQ
jgi:hypothetical protein